ncbi:DNA polymerase III subunit delta [Psychromarinibacter halotolerans]|uniref:DNA-directed DNA polymerase n=1 Tax=Psychromarinibacter halotolerans TaxID=1775175 RepID=A0ABV7GPC8_9RHOB|nr:DNA polymerase III subunit delta [Psychromarinibacter halotolerans]MDF0595587.1 DNA polymerase III subunit delta [Psychromarinibacter halotolerans]
MKLSARDSASHFSKPDPGCCGTLIYGQDAMRVALKRQELVAAIVGPRGEEEMRLTRIPASELRKDAALVTDAVRETGFFPGPRAVFVEDAGDGLAKTIAAAFDGWRPGDAHVVVTAGSLTAKSALRKLFEGLKNGFAVGIYNDPPSREELEAELAKAGLKNVGGDGMSELVALSRMLDPGDLRQTIEKLALFKLDDPAPLSPDDVAACAPATTEAAMDDVLNVVAEARTREIGPLMLKLEGQGVQPVGLVIGATRHFRTLYAAASDPGGPGAGLGRARPPVFGPRRDRMQRQAQGWGAARLAQALEMLTDTDLQLRSAQQRAPAMALVERTLIRLSMLASARR